MRMVKIAGLARVSAAMFAAWGAVVAAKGVQDRFLGGEPEANLYAPEPWAFVTREQWARYAAFELVYGLALLGLAFGLWRAARFLPATVERKAPAEPSFID